jgi:hypothetical protein
VEALLLAWFSQNGRDLPWRRTRDPYAILVSEVMLQQTHIFFVDPSLFAGFYGLNGVFKGLVEPLSSHSSPRVCSHGVRMIDRFAQRECSGSEHLARGSRLQRHEGEMDALAPRSRQAAARI